MKMPDQDQPAPPFAAPAPLDYESPKIFEALPNEGDSFFSGVVLGIMIFIYGGLSLEHVARGSIGIAVAVAVVVICGWLGVWMLRRPRRRLLLAGVLLTVSILTLLTGLFMAAAAIL
jgi:hypothetical protein